MLIVESLISEDQFTHNYTLRLTKSKLLFHHSHARSALKEFFQPFARLPVVRRG